MILPLIFGCQSIRGKIIFSYSRVKSFEFFLRVSWSQKNGGPSGLLSSLIVGQGRL